VSAIDGRTAFGTGAAQGLGEAIAAALIAAGARVGGAVDVLVCVAQPASNAAAEADICRRVIAIIDPSNLEFSGAHGKVYGNFHETSGRLCAPNACRHKAVPFA